MFGWIISIILIITCMNIYPINEQFLIAAGLFAIAGSIANRSNKIKIEQVEKHDKDSKNTEHNSFYDE